MFPPSPPPPPPFLPSGGVAPSADSMSGGADSAAADGGGYEYEVKRQRLLQGGAAAASGMLTSYYPSLPPQPQQSSSAAALQSSIAASLNSYFSAASAAPSAAQHPLPQHDAAPSATPVMYSSYHQYPVPTPPAAVPSNPPHLSNPSVESSYMSSSAPYINPMNKNATPTHLNSVAPHPSVTNMNPNLMSNAGRSINHVSNTSYPSSAHMPTYPSTVPASSSLSPFRAASPPGLAGLHPAGSPPHPPPPMMPYEQRSPHFLHSPPLVPPPFFMGHSFPPFSALSHFFPVVRLRGLPFNCTESDVYDFFRGLDVVDVLLIHKQGRFSGEAYCVFGLPMQVELALYKNRQSIRQRYVEVFRSKKHEYYMAVAAEVSGQDKSGLAEERVLSFPSTKSSIDKEHLEHTGVLKLRGLPFSSSKRDIMEFFKDFGLKDENIQFVVHSDGRATGEAYVEFEGPSQSKQAMSRDKMMLGSRYVELFPSSSDEAAKATGRHKK